MIAERSKRNSTLPNVHVLNSFFYNQLKDNGYESVKRWTKKLDIFTMDKVLCPINLEKHWTLVVSNYCDNKLRIYDYSLEKFLSF